ncbi:MULTISPECIES: hypothetical protein [Lactiplantibacillus]|nr:hypothetical protein [Lactiplantibacillus plantarum]ASX22130.1 hypothetical protein BGV74_10225 [Lactiplantibacillus plantarum]MYV33975.1 hypothetical protein [Lactiplantibacillus plantarum]QFY66040.1 hypothetical protein CEB40_10395 [Lactiplantibacillus plantarum]QHM33489.1 hypothetical protein C7M35_00853 [Lactiplantibacillus plantarum]WMY71601.1 hypothetical protein RF634_05115 [Lactiplantibacillus plantarum]
MLIDILAVSIMFMFSLILVSLAVFIVVFAFLGDIDTTLFVIKDSISMSISKKKQKNSIQSTTEVINMLFRKTAEKISGMSEKELAKKINSNKQEAKKFKKIMTDTLKKTDIEFVSEDDITFFMKRNRSFGVVQQFISNLNQYSQPKFNYLRKLGKQHKEGLISDEEYLQKVLRAMNKTDKELRLEINEAKRKNSNFSAKGLSFQIIQKIFSSDESVNINTLYSSKLGLSS